MTPADKKRAPEQAKESAKERLSQLAPGFGGRVEAAVKTFPSIPQAATAIGLGHNQVRRIIDEATVPSFPAIATLAKKSGYRFEWLAFAEPPEKSDVPPERAALPAAFQPADFIFVPELEAHAAAGLGLMNQDYPPVKAIHPIPRIMFANMKIDPARLWILQAKGTSMEPDIRDGDFMVILTGEEEIRDGNIYVFSIGDDTMVKQVQLEPDGSLQLISKNAAFAPRHVSAEAREQLHFAGRLVVTMKRFG